MAVGLTRRGGAAVAGGDVDWRLAALLTVAVIPGAGIGAWLTIRTAERRLRRDVGLFLALVALVYLVTETRALLEQP